MEQLSVIREACARLRRLPDPRWGQAPRTPLGARPPQLAPNPEGRTVEAIVRELIDELQRADAELRGVDAFAINVERFALPDVVETLAKSLAASSDAAAHSVLERVANELRNY